MLLRVIASVDETARLNPSHVSGARDAASSARPILYVARDQGLQLKLRNVVVALKAVGPNSSRTIHASVKFYSKESTLFRKDSRFPDKLGTYHDGAQAAETIWNAVVSNLLWWELQQLQPQDFTQGALAPFQEDRTMSPAQEPLVFTAEIVSGIGNATRLTLTGSSVSGSRQNGAAISQSLTGSVLSLNGIVSFKSPHGTQNFIVSTMETTNQNLPRVGIMSENTSVQFNTTFMPAAEQLHLPKGLISKELWVSATRKDIGGYDDILEQIVHHMYGFLERALQPSESRKDNSCFQAPCKGILITGRPGTGKSLLASKLAEHSGLPCTILNCPDVFQTGKRVFEHQDRET